MRISATGIVMVETMVPRIRMMRFERPDVREFLYAAAAIADCPLYREILDVVLNDLPTDWTLIVNLKHLLPIGTAFYRCLLQLRHFVRSRGARLVLCNLSREHRKVFELFGAFRLFTVVHTESDAARAAAEGKGEVTTLIGPGPIVITCRL